MDNMNNIDGLQASVHNILQPVIPDLNELQTNQNEDKNSILTNILAQKCEKNQSEIAANSAANGAMTSSVASIPDDSTPSDSGVQLLDSISSGGMNESLMSNSGLELDTSYPAEIINNVAILKQLQESADALALQFDVVLDEKPSFVINEKIVSNELLIVEPPQIDDNIKTKENLEPPTMTKSDIDNSNVETSAAAGGMDIADIPDEMMTSNCSTFDAESIVYRRKVKKQRTSSTSSAGGPKKRVSFHEDILKNTKTDNIHIEHGFITYKGYSKKYPHSVSRYSWCSQGDSDGDNDEPNNTYYRNACSDVLAYGKTDLYEQGDTALIQFDQSGVFEYGPQKISPSAPQMPQPPESQPIEPNENNNPPELNENNPFYQCKCSSSNSSLASGDSLNSIDDDNNKKRNYPQAKSNSCDCIGMNAATNMENNNVCGTRGQPIINDNCYFSDPSIETMDDAFDTIIPKSVWRKEMKPKNSCLKKTKRQNGVIQEQDLATKVKKFNVHQLSDMNQFIGSLRNIFSITLPERGVPEGCEDLQPVYECLPDVDHHSPINKPKSFLSKSFDNGLEKKKKERPKNFVHAVDIELRRENPEPEVVVPIVDDDDEVMSDDKVELRLVTDVPLESTVPNEEVAPSAYRNKYIVNCESTVFEHTGIFCENESGGIRPTPIPLMQILPSPSPTPTPIVSTATTTQFAQKLSKIFKSFTTSQTIREKLPVPQQLLTQAPAPSAKQAQLSPQHKAIRQKEIQKHSPVAKASIDHRNYEQSQTQSSQQPSSRKTSLTQQAANKFNGHDIDCMATNMSMTSSMISSISDKNSIFSTATLSSISNTTTSHEKVHNDLPKNVPAPIATTAELNSPTKSRHLASPLRRRPITSRFDRSQLSPDLFGGILREPINPMDLIAQEFDDILTVTTTTDTDLNESDIEILDYPSSAELTQASQQQQEQVDLSNHLLRPPSSKSSLINRFLRNVTQKKIHDATIKKNNILSAKYREPPKLFGNLYVKAPKRVNLDMVADINAEIAHEIQSNGNGAAKHKNEVNDNVVKPLPVAMIDLQHGFGVGVGEVCVDIFNGNDLHILRDDKEILMKVFKLYTGYSLEGHMTPVLVFLTDKTLYVTDLVRNRLCNRFVLPYTELDVILIGPHGNTVLLSNSARDMQQVLLAGGPYPTDGLVSSLEMCARRGGTKLPAIGQLTLDHLAPLQAFVRENSPVSRNDAWVYYAVVSVPANILSHDEEPLGPNIKGFLMHRQLSFSVDHNQPWLAGYFLLKAGVLYMFSDSNQKLPSMTINLSECKGARRAVNSPRPHCFELILKTGFLQLAAPDEYVASDWLQTLVQSASGLFEMQEKHKTLGCTIVITSNHLITLRENFEAPLRRLNSIEQDAPRQIAIGNTTRKLSMSTNMSETCSNISTSTRMSDRLSSTRSSPSHSSAIHAIAQPEKSYSSISSIYGKNSGVAVKTCAALHEIVSIRIPAKGDHWWCILEFSCQEVQENSDDLVVFFATNSDMRRFLTMLETLWQTKKDDPFPISVLSEDDAVGHHCGELFADLNRSWEPLLTAALGYPQ